MTTSIKLYVKVCSKCGRQVHPHTDHNLGDSRTVYCDHGRGGAGTMEIVTWEKIQVAPLSSLLQRLNAHESNSMAHSETASEDGTLQWQARGRAEAYRDVIDWLEE